MQRLIRNENESKGLLEMMLNNTSFGEIFYQLEFVGGTVLLGR